METSTNSTSDQDIIYVKIYIKDKLTKTLAIGGKFAMDFTLKRLVAFWRNLEEKYNIIPTEFIEHRIKIGSIPNETAICFGLDLFQNERSMIFYAKMLKILNDVFDYTTRNNVSNIKNTLDILFNMMENLPAFYYTISEEDIIDFHKEFDYSYVKPLDIKYCIAKQIQLPFAIKVLLHLFEQNIDIVNEIGQYLYVIMVK